MAAARMCESDDGVKVTVIDHQLIEDTDSHDCVIVGYGNELEEENEDKALDSQIEYLTSLRKQLEKYKCCSHESPPSSFHLVNTVFAWWGIKTDHAQAQTACEWIDNALAACKDNPCGKKTQVWLVFNAFQILIGSLLKNGAEGEVYTLLTQAHEFYQNSIHIYVSSGSPSPSPPP